MAETITAGGVNVSSKIRRDRATWVESANLGKVGTGEMVYQDAAGSYVVPYWKDLTVDQTASTPARIQTGFIGVAKIKRGQEDFKIAAARELTIAILDGNDLLRRRLIRGHDANRPAEPYNTRMAWLLSAELSLVDVFDFGRVQTVDLDLDKADMRAKYPGDVIASMVTKVKFNYYIRWNGDEEAWELVCRDDNQQLDDTWKALTDTCTLSIANDGSADGDMIYGPLEEEEQAELTVDPEDVWSGVDFMHAEGRVYESDDGIAAAYTRRETTSEDSTVNTDATATAAAQVLLEESATPEQSMPLGIRVAAAKVGLIEAGMRIPVLMQHMVPEGWGDPGRYARILERTVKQPQNDDNTYDVFMDLVPQEAAPVPGDCVDIYTNTPSDIYYPLGGPAPCCAPNLVGSNIAYYFRPGWPDPFVPDPTYGGQWHWPTYGGGGVGSVDYFASGFQNQLRFILVGNGTLDIKTERWQGQLQPYTVAVYHMTPNPVQIGTTLSGVAGASTEVEITAATDGACISLVVLRADARTNAYIGMGWSSAEWDAA